MMWVYFIIFLSISYRSISQGQVLTIHFQINMENYKIYGCLAINCEGSKSHSCYYLIYKEHLTQSSSNKTIFFRCAGNLLTSPKLVKALTGSLDLGQCLELEIPKPGTAWLSTSTPATRTWRTHVKTLSSSMLQNILA